MNIKQDGPLSESNFLLKCILVCLASENNLDEDSISRFFGIITNFGSKNVDGKKFFGKTFGSKTILDQTKLAQHNFLP